MNLTFVTQNKNKLDDAQKTLSDFTIHGVDIDIPEIQSLDLHEIIQAKLKYAYDHVKEPCFVMDTGLFFDCLNGFPGPFIKQWYEQSVGPDKTCKIAKAFGEYGCEFKTALGYYDGKEMKFFDRSLRGSLPKKPRGDKGYVWDVIFIPEGEERTFAEMEFEEKMEYAPQKKLLEQLRDYL